MDKYLITSEQLAEILVKIRSRNSGKAMKQIREIEETQFLLTSEDSVEDTITGIKNTLELAAKAAEEVEKPKAEEEAKVEDN